MSYEFDFYDKTNLKSYNLNESMRYQLDMLDRLDVFTRKHCENVASLTCRLCEYLHCNKNFTDHKLHELAFKVSVNFYFVSLQEIMIKMYNKSHVW